MMCSFRFVLSVVALAVASCSSGAPTRAWQVEQPMGPVHPLQVLDLRSPGAALASSSLTGHLGKTPVTLTVLDEERVGLLLPPDIAVGHATLDVDGYKPLALEVEAVAEPTDPLGYANSQLDGAIAALDAWLAANPSDTITTPYVVDAKMALQDIEHKVAQLSPDDVRTFAILLAENGDLTTPVTGSSARLRPQPVDCGADGTQLCQDAEDCLSAWSAFALGATIFAAGVAAAPETGGLSVAAVLAGAAVMKKAAPRVREATQRLLQDHVIPYLFGESNAQVAAVVPAQPMGPSMMPFTNAIPRTVSLTGSFRSISADDVDSKSPDIAQLAATLEGLPKQIDAVNAAAADGVTLMPIDLTPTTEMRAVPGSDVSLTSDDKNVTLTNTVDSSGALVVTVTASTCDGDYRDFASTIRYRPSGMAALDADVPVTVRDTCKGCFDTDPQQFVASSTETVTGSLIENNTERCGTSGFFGVACAPMQFSVTSAGGDSRFTGGNAYDQMFDQGSCTGTYTWLNQGDLTLVWTNHYMRESGHIVSQQTCSATCTNTATCTGSCTVTWTAVSM